MVRLIITRNILRRAPALLTALLLPACVDTPPTTPQVAALDQNKLGLTGEAAPQAPQQWWKAFQDPQVDLLAALVMAGNPTLAAAMARLRAAEAELTVSRAQNLPRLDLDASQQRTLFSQNSIIPPPYGGSYQWFGNITAAMNWNLDFWGRQAALIEKARHTAQAAALDAEGAHLALSGAFAQAYVNLFLNYQYGDIADATVAQREEIVKITQGRLNAGLENASALEQAKALLSIAKADQLRFAAAREMDLHAIAALAGRGGDLYQTITRPHPNLNAALPLPRQLPADLLARRPDILAAKARVLAAMEGRQAAQADFYPDINLAAAAGFQAIGFSNLLRGDSLTLGVGPALHLPIFDAGKLRAHYARATADLDLAVADYNAAVLAAIKQVADAMTQVASLEAQRLQQQDAVQSAQRAFRIAEDRYRGGLQTQLPMLTAEATLLQARQALASVVAGAAQQRIALMLMVGGGFDPSAHYAELRQSLP